MRFNILSLSNPPHPRSTVAMCHPRPASPLHLLLAGHVRDGSDVSHDNLGRLGLAGARLARDDNAGVLPPPLHGLIGGIGDGEDVWRPLEDFATCRKRHKDKINTQE